ncbi:polyubiquitin-like [Arapaima gigas]
MIKPLLAQRFPRLLTMELIIKFLDKTFFLTVDKNTTVSQLKSLIEQQENVPCASQRLTGQNGQTVQLSDDHKTLAQYGLCSGSVVIVIVTKPTVIQVFLKNEKHTHTYDVVPGETVLQFKRKVYNKESVPENQQRLIHEGIQMDDHKKLEDYGVKNHSTIFLALRLRGG